MPDKPFEKYSLDFTGDKKILRKILIRRNYPNFDGYPTDRLLFNPTCYEFSSVYELLKKYSFRIVLRDIIKYRESFDSQKLAKFADIKSVERFLDSLLSLKVIKRNKDDTYDLAENKVNSFGDTLEWFTACLMKNEFSAPSGWGIKLKARGVGGDYDVISEMENNLIFIETKSSPPSHIDQSSMREFIARIYSLYPDMAVFFVDTHLRMKDKIVPMIEYALRTNGRECSFKVLKNEVYQFRHCLYITNSKPDIILNLRTIISDFLSHRSPFYDG